MSPGESVVSPNQLYVTPGYLEALRVPLRQGRFFAESDTVDAPGVVIVDEQLARRFWPNANPVGRRMYLPQSPDDVVKPGPEGYLAAGRRAWSAASSSRDSWKKARPRVSARTTSPTRRMPTRTASGSRSARRATTSRATKAARRARARRDRSRGAALRQLRDAAARRQVARLAPRADAAARDVRWRRAPAGGARDLRCARVSGRDANERNRHPDCARQRRQGHPPAGSARGDHAGRSSGSSSGWPVRLRLRGVITSQLYGVGAFDARVVVAAALVLGAAALLACAGPARRASRVDPAVTLQP